MLAVGGQAPSIDDILVAMGGRRPPAEPPADETPAAPPAAAPAPPAAVLPPLDEAHRVAGVSGVDYRPRSLWLKLGAPQARALATDCAHVFGAQEGSNWLGATATPRCALECLARAVFERHTAGATFDASRSGAEWWAQVAATRDWRDGCWERRSPSLRRSQSLRGSASEQAQPPSKPHRRCAAATARGRRGSSSTGMCAIYPVRPAGFREDASLRHALLR